MLAASTSATRRPIWTIPATAGTCTWPSATRRPRPPRGSTTAIPALAAASAREPTRWERSVIWTRAALISCSGRRGVARRVRGARLGRSSRPGAEPVRNRPVFWSGRRGVVLPGRGSRRRVGGGLQRRTQRQGLRGIAPAGEVVRADPGPGHGPTRGVLGPGRCGRGRERPGVPAPLQWARPAGAVRAHRRGVASGAHGAGVGRPRARAGVDLQDEDRARDQGRGVGHAGDGLRLRHPGPRRAAGPRHRDFGGLDRSRRRGPAGQPGRLRQDRRRLDRPAVGQPERGRGAIQDGRSLDPALRKPGGRRPRPPLRHGGVRPRGRAHPGRRRLDCQQ